MSSDNNKLVNQSSMATEQVDLIDVVIQIWREKVTVGLWIVAAIVIATIYLFVAKEKWTSTAIVTQPDAGQVSGYINVFSILYGTNAPMVGDIQQQFIGRFASSFSALSETLNNHEEPEILKIVPSERGQTLPLKLSYTGTTAEEAKQKLAKYIEQVNDSVVKDLRADLKVNTETRIYELKDLLASQEKVAIEQRDLRIKQISQALKVAQDSNIKMPQTQRAENLSADTLFILGSDALSSMKNNADTQPLTLPDSYYDTRQNLLAALSLKSYSGNLGSYRYILKPTHPIRRDSPKRAMLLIMAVLAGGVVGAGFVLGRNALRNYKNQE